MSLTFYSSGGLRERYMVWRWAVLESSSVNDLLVVQEEAGVDFLGSANRRPAFDFRLLA